MRPRLLALGVRKFRLTPEEAEDVVQTVLLKTVTLNPTVRDPFAYLATAFRRGCINLLASSGRRLAAAELGDDLPDFGSVQALQRMHDLQAVRRAFHHADRQCVELVRCHYLSDQSQTATAERFGYSPRSIGRRLKHCLERIRAWLRK
jgi:RNA polymerase sigma factor (sigma-70 family)